MRRKPVSVQVLRRIGEGNEEGEGHDYRSLAQDHRN